MKPLRIVFFGSGAFGLPTLEALAKVHDVALVVSQPDRPAGRGRALTPTPIAAWAAERGIPLRKPGDVNLAAEIAAIHDARAEAFVVIAFGQKLSRGLLGETFAINLHASLLPAYRGAAPINWAVIDGCRETGVSIIGLAERMDAGLVYGRVATPVDPLETAGELHDRLADLGPRAVLEALASFAAGTLTGEAQDESKATKARKFTKDDGRLDVARLEARTARCRIHGLTPWPGCDVEIDGERVRLLRVRDQDGHGTPGTVTADLSIACRSGLLAVLSLQPHGGRPMTLEEFRNGHRLEPGMTVRPRESAAGAAS